MSKKYSNEELDNLNQIFDEHRLSAIGSIELMLEFLETHNRGLRLEGWKPSEIKKKLKPILKTLNEEC